MRRRGAGPAVLRAATGAAGPAAGIPRRISRSRRPGRRNIAPGRGLVVLHRGETSNPVVFAMSTSYMVLALAVILGLVFIVFRLFTLGRTLARGAVWAGDCAG